MHGKGQEQRDVSAGELRQAEHPPANVWEQPRHLQAGEELSQVCGRASVTPCAGAVGGKFCVVLGFLCPLLALGSQPSLGLPYPHTPPSMPCLSRLVFPRDGKGRSEMCEPCPLEGRCFG